MKNEFSWSKSRDAVFRECLRKYWFQYYGSWGGWSEDAPGRTREAYILKKLHNRFTWAGDRVHRSAHALIAALRGGKTPDAEIEVATALEAMRRDFRASREGRYRGQPGKVCGLFEHEYRLDVADEVWKELAERVGACIRAFAQSPVFDSLRALSPSDWLDVEELSSFALDGLKVYVQLDCAHRADGGIAIYDWKTGRGANEQHELQMGCYALYATHKWGVAPEQVVTILFNLATGERTERRSTPEQIEYMRDYIHDSADEMLFPLADPEANRAEEEMFDLADDEGVCRRCSFLKICPRWRGQEAESGGQNS